MNYERIYNEFIADRRIKEASLTGYTEKHHIVPRCMGGDDSDANMIALTPGDHFFAHLLLAQAHGGKQWVAVWAMLKMDASKDNIRAALGGKRRWVEIARKESRIVAAESTRRQHKDPAYISRLHSPEAQKKRSATMKIRLAQNPKHAEAMQKGAQSESARALRGAATKRRWEENYASMIEKNVFIKNNPMKNPESAEKVRQAVIAYCARPEIKAAKSARISGDKNPAKRAEVALKISKATKSRDMSENGRKRTVVNLDTGEVFKSIEDANCSIGRSNSHIVSVCTGKRSTAGGYRWAYADMKEAA
jgi:hypothetical protein